MPTPLRLTIPEPMRRILPWALPLALAVGFGLTAVTMTRNLIQRERQALAAERQRLVEQFPNPQPVLIAAKDIPRETQIGESDLKVQQVPITFIQPYATNSPGDLVGKITVAPIAEGEQILQNKLRRPEEPTTAATLSGITPEGRRAVTFAVDTLTGVGGFVRPGDNVDILWTFAVPGQNSQTVTLTLFQDVPVLAIGPEMKGRPVAAPTAAPADASQPAQQTVTVALIPQEASLLLFSREHGRVQLTLRPQQETGAVAVAPANIDTLMERAFGGMRAPAAPSAPPPRQVEVFRGLQRDVVVLSDNNPGS